MLNELYPLIQHRAVRDLAWVLLSPSLFSHLEQNDLLTEDFIDSTGELTQWLLAIDQAPDELIEFIGQRSQARIGIYFEQLLGFYFTKNSRFQLLQQNLQVNGKKNTVGEFDFIVIDNTTKAFFHIECAVKFYLGQYDSSTLDNNIQHYNWHEWIGPNKKDSLSIKMNSMLSKQIHLSSNETGAQLLKKHNIPAEKIQKRLLLRGRFFKKDHACPYSANDSVCSYQWFYFNDFMSIEEFSNDFLILPRSYWLSPIINSDVENLGGALNKRSLKNIISDDVKKGINTWKVVELDKNNNEVSRFFIVN